MHPFGKNSSPKNLKMSQTTVTRSAQSSPSTSRATAAPKSLEKTSRQTPKLIIWRDIPKWNHTHSPFLNLPLEILDMIVDPENGLSPQDHIALYGTCKQIRQAYTSDFWEVAISLHFSWM